MIKIAVLAEGDGEPRVAVSPETIKKFAKLGLEVRVESGAGRASNFTDDALKEAGAKITGSADEALRDADLLLAVRRPSAATISALPKDAMVVAMLDPYGDRAGLEDIAKSGVTAFSMEFMPRISRAQSMDVLSSQSNLAGYKAVIDAAAEFGRAMPMMMTAAGTVPPAKAFIMGAGVAGLQAIATARRLGAVVTATDVRPAAKEQVESLGAKFIAVEDEEFKQAETAAGYAKEMSVEYKKKQAELVAKHIASQNMVITTALIPGRPAPELISREMVEAMPEGAIIVDMAVERGGNCAVSKPGEVISHAGVTVMGRLNLAGGIPANASTLYAKNLLNFLGLMIDKESGDLKVDWDDEIIQGTLIARGGELVHPSFKS